LNIFKDTNHRK